MFYFLRYANVLKPQQLKQENSQKKEETKSTGVLVWSLKIIFYQNIFKLFMTIHW